MAASQHCALRRASLLPAEPAPTLARAAGTEQGTGVAKEGRHQSRQRGGTLGSPREVQWDHQGEDRRSLRRGDTATPPPPKPLLSCPDGCIQQWVPAVPPGPLTRGCSAGGCSAQGHSAGVGGGRGTLQGAHRAPHPGRALARTRSHQHSHGGMAPPQHCPCWHSSGGMMKCSQRNAALWHSCALSGETPISEPMFKGAPAAFVGHPRTWWHMQNSMHSRGAWN